MTGLRTCRGATCSSAPHALTGSQPCQLNQRGVGVIRSTVAGWTNAPRWFSFPLRKFEISRDAVDREFDNPPLLSPDGQRIVYVHDSSIWVRDFARLVPTKLVEEGDTPFWSADGQQIGFERERKLWRVRVGGGEPSLVCDLPDRASIVSAAWSADGTIWLAAWRGGLYSVSARGGDPELALETRADEVDFHDVSVLPDQSSVMFVNHQVNPETGDWLKDSTLIVLRDGKRHEVMIDPGIVTIHTPVYSRGYLLYHRTGSGQGLWAAPFSPVDLEVTGPPFLLVADAGRPSVSDDGTLTYLPGLSDGDDDIETIQLMWVDRNGVELGAVGPPRKQSHYFDLSPDGTKVVVSAGDDADEADLWVYSADGAGSYQLTSDPGVEGAPTWSADGADIYYTSVSPTCNRFRCIDIVSRPASVSGEATVLGNGGFFPAVAPDRKNLLYTGFTGGASAGIVLLTKSLDGDAPARNFFPDSGERLFHRFSPDGRFIAYVTDTDLGRRHVSVSSYPDLSWTVRISPERGEWPVWHPDGDRIYFVKNFDVMEVELTLEPRLRAGQPRRLFSLQEYAFEAAFGGTPFFDVGADGERFLTTRVDPRERASRGIVVVQNWVAEYSDP